MYCPISRPQRAMAAKMTISQAYADQFAGTLRRNWARSFCGFISPPLRRSAPVSRDKRASRNGRRGWLGSVAALRRRGL